MDSLFIKQERLFSHLPSTEREIAQSINWDNRLISIRGSRGVGKTTLMLQYIKRRYGAGTREALYCSLDSVYFSNRRLLDLAEQFYLNGGKQLFLDEVHKYPTWSKEIKEIYDCYPDLKVVISGSSLLNILNAEADLSRRCMPYTMPGLSFREYLKFYNNINLPSYSLKAILEKPDEICSLINKECRPLAMFSKYLQEGYYPFFDGNKDDYYVYIENIVNLVLEQELPLLCGIDPAYIRRIKALLEILTHTVPFEVDTAKLSSLLSISRNSLLSYLQSLAKSEMITLLYSDNLSVKKLQKPDKIYLNNTNMLYALSSQAVDIGTARETFVVNQLSNNHSIEYGKSTGDFRVDRKITFEVGGPDKKFSQIAGVDNSYILSDGIEYATGRRLPIWLVGLTY